MTCRRCGKAAPEGSRASTAAWCVACQKATLAPPERFLNFPRMEVETRGNAKWEYRLLVPGQNGWRVLEVKVHKPGISYRVLNNSGVGYQRPEYVTVDRLAECLQRIAEATLIEARSWLVDARNASTRARKNYEEVRQLVDLLTADHSGNIVKVEVPDFWERLHGVSSDHEPTASSEMAPGQER